MALIKKIGVHREAVPEEKPGDRPEPPAPPATRRVQPVAKGMARPWVVWKESTLR